MNKCNKHVLNDCIRWNKKWFWAFWCENRWNRCCGCKDMMKRSCMDLFVISRKWLGLIWNYFWIFGVLFRNLWPAAWFWTSTRGIFAKWCGVISFKLFSNEERRGLGSQLADHMRIKCLQDVRTSDCRAAIVQCMPISHSRCIATVPSDPTTQCNRTATVPGDTTLATPSQ
jgi:hypothetical protein